MSDTSKLSKWLLKQSGLAKFSPFLIKMRLMRWMAQRSFLVFCMAVKPDYMPTRFHRYLCRRLQQQYKSVLTGEDKNFIVEIQPQIGKSLTCSELYPAWVLGRSYLDGMVTCPVVCASYGASLAEQKSSNCRDIINSDVYQIIFPDTRISPETSAKDFWKTTTGGSYRAVGVGGGLTGMPGKFMICLPGDQRITTSQGELAIQDIVDQQLPVEVLSWNEATGQTEYRAIEEYEVNPARPILEFELSDGTKFECTEDHPVYVDGKGYIPAKDVQNNDILLVLTAPELVEQVTVEAITAKSEVPDRVYNLRIKDNHNYFVNGVLTHNCDDPFKDRAEADSETTRESTWKWWQTVFMSRRQNVSGVTLVNCLVGDTRVLSAQGTWKKIHRFKVGEKALSFDPVARKFVPQVIKAVIPQGKAEVYRLTTPNHTIEGTAAHPFLRKADNGELVWTKLADLQVGDYIVDCRRSPGKKRSSYTSDELWLLGFMYGDGWITEHPNSKGSMRWVTCVAKGIYPELNQRVLDLFKQIFGVELKETKYGYYKTEVANVARWFIKANFKGKAKTKRIPNYISILDYSAREAFLKGFLAADGHQAKTGLYYVGLCNRDLVEDVKLLATGLGFKVSNITHTQKLSQPPNSKKPFLADKYSISIGFLKSANTHGLARVEKVEKLNTLKRVYDLSIEGTENFVANGLVVHNTRWHIDDVSGRLSAQYNADKESSKQSFEYDHWEQLTFPAFALEDEYIQAPDGTTQLFRKAGEVLCPERFSYETMVRRRNSTEVYEWSALYMQQPILKENAKFKAEWFRYYDPADIKYKELNWFILVDPASSKKKGADNTVVRAVGKERTSGFWYLGDEIAGKMDAGQQVDAIFTMVKQYPGAKVFIEGVAYQRTLQYWVEERQRLELNFFHVDLLERKQVQSKEERIEGLVPLYKNGMIFHRAGGSDREYEAELLSFPMGKHDDRCPIGPTLIATKKGDIPIKDVSVGDYVLTRQGYKKVLNSGQTGHKRVITKAGLSATPNHPVYTRRGWIPLEALKETDIITICEKQLNGMGLSSEDIQNLKQRAIVSTIRDGLDLESPIYTEKFGNHAMAKFLKDSISITLTRTLATIRSKILSYLATTSIKKLILAMQGQGVEALSGITRKLASFGGRPRAGEVPSKRQKATPARTAKRVSKTFPGQTIYSVGGSAKTGSISARLEQLKLRPKLNSALTTFSALIARLSARIVLPQFATHLGENTTLALPVGKKEGTGSATPRGQKRLWSKTASLEESPLIIQVSVHDLDSVLKNVPTKGLCVDSGSVEDVYNLTVEDANEYFANGILIHNCDAVSFAKEVVPKTTIAETPEQFKRRQREEREEFDPFSPFSRA